jgi:acylphosphatase
MKAFHAIVEGEVQGVGFRYSAQRRARALGLDGWVRNMADGSVEVWAEGAKESLDDFLEWLSRGPPSAEVTQVRSTWEMPRGIYRDFGIAF